MISELIRSKFIFLTQNYFLLGNFYQGILSLSLFCKVNQETEL